MRSFLLLPCLYLSGILLGILHSELVSVYFWYTAHHGITVFLTASSIPPSAEQNWECYKRENECLKELAMNRGNKTHWWIESKVQNERKAFGYRGACGTSHLLIPKAAAVKRCRLGVGDPLCLWAKAGTEFTSPLSVSWLSLAAELEPNPGILMPNPLLLLLPNEKLNAPN